jgi:hypothetical protein
MHNAKTDLQAKVKQHHPVVYPFSSQLTLFRGLALLVFGLGAMD